MRFGRKSRRRHTKSKESVSVDDSSSGGSDTEMVEYNEDTVLHEDSQLVEDTETVIVLDSDESASSQSSSVNIPDGEPTQILLTSLGRFQRELKTVQDGKGTDDWTDICMNQLIISTEVALTEGWSDVFDALTGTGRILQSHENNQLSEKSIPFLNQSYEVLCSMVGDLIAGSVRQGVREQWNDLYRHQTELMDEEGIILIPDDEEFNDSTQSGIRAEENTDSSREQLDELPTLDELPPLTDLLKKEHVSAAEELDEIPEVTGEVKELDPNEGLELFEAGESDGPTDSETSMAADENDTADDVIESSEESETERFEPPKRVVEIIDRLCEQLRSLPELEGISQSTALETFVGGLTALQRDALEHKHEIASQLSSIMLEATQATAKIPNQITDDFSDLGFGFCGVFVEALNEGITENTMEWDNECREWTAKIQALVDTAPVEKPTKPEIVEEVSKNVARADDSEFELLSPKTITKEESEIAPSAEIKDDVTPRTIDTEDQDESQNLLNAAQNAALKGDGEGAKNFALQAAAVIAKLEVTKATEKLHEAETKLKNTIQDSESARASVKEEEKKVKNAAKQVGTSEKNVQSIQTELDDQAQEMTSLQNELEKIDRKIETLQKKQQEQKEKIKAAEEHHDQTQQNKNAAEEETRQNQNVEKEYRAELETKRQLVKEHQRNTKEIETEIETHRAKLEQEQKSHNDIAQTIDLLGKNRPNEKEENDDNGLLF
jgi:hypothetical protein